MRYVVLSKWFMFKKYMCQKYYYIMVNGVIPIKALEEKILKEGAVLPGNILKVGNFLNHQIDTAFLKEIGDEIARLYKDTGVNKILTIEASGIAIAVAAGFSMNVPVVFAKKHKSSNVEGDVYSSSVESFTHKTIYNIVVSKDYIGKDDRVLIVDDFLANGNALIGLTELVSNAGATVVGAAIAIEKGFQRGGDELRNRGMRVESLAIVERMTENSLEFRPQ